MMCCVVLCECTDVECIAFAKCSRLGVGAFGLLHNTQYMCCVITSQPMTTYHHSRYIPIYYEGTLRLCVVYSYIYIGVYMHTFLTLGAHAQ